MLGERYFRLMICGVSVILVSELVYHTYLHVLKALQQRKRQQHIRHVVLTNELLRYCDECVQRMAASSKKTAVSDDQTSAKVGGVCSKKFCADNNIGRVIRLIDDCQYTIDLAMYMFTSHEITKALLRASNRGVNIRYITDKTMVTSNNSPIHELTEYKVPIRYPLNTALMHHKYCILDGSQRIATTQNEPERPKHCCSILMTGSLNWTMPGCSVNFENFMITSNAKLIQLHEAEFDRMWIQFREPGLCLEKKVSFKTNQRKEDIL